MSDVPWELAVIIGGALVSVIGILWRALVNSNSEHLKDIKDFYKKSGGEDAE